jgi:lipid-binding SYLF domain-containing protein
MIRKDCLIHDALLATAAVLLLVSLGSSASAATAQDLDRDAAQVLQTLYKANPAASHLPACKAILVFPKIVKAGLVFGGSYGEGVR